MRCAVETQGATLGVDPILTLGPQGWFEHDFLFPPNAFNPYFTWNALRPTSLARVQVRCTRPTCKPQPWPGVCSQKLGRNGAALCASRLPQVLEIMRLNSGRPSVAGVCLARTLFGTHAKGSGSYCDRCLWRCVPAQVLKPLRAA